MATSNKLLDRTQVEEVFGIPKRFLETAGLRGDGPPFIKIGRLVKYRVEDIESWLLKQRTDPGQA